MKLFNKFFIVSLFFIFLIYSCEDFPEPWKIQRHIIDTSGNKHVAKQDSTGTITTQPNKGTVQTHGGWTGNKDRIFTDEEINKEKKSLSDEVQAEDCTNFMGGGYNYNTFDQQTDPLVRLHELKCAIQKKVDLDSIRQSSSDGGRYLLHSAVIKNDLPSIQFLLEVANVNIDFSDTINNSRAIAYTVDYNLIEIMKYFLEHKAYAGEVDSQGRTLITKVLSTNDHMPMLKYLVETLNFNVNEYDHHGVDRRTPLRVAVPNMEYVKYLIAHGANLDDKSPKDGYTALMIASKDGYLEAVKYLVEHGADVNIVSNIYKYTAIFFAYYGTNNRVHRDVLEYLSKVPTLNVRYRAQMFNNQDIDICTVLQNEQAILANLHNCL